MNLNLVKKLLFIAALSFSMAACSSTGAGDKKSELEALKQQRTALDDKIKKLETELGSSAQDSTPVNALLVVAKPAATQVFDHYIELQGKVDAEDNVTVTPQMPAMIQTVSVVVGQHVSKGQVMASLDAATISAQIEAVKNSWELANTLYEKQKSLWEQNIGTEVQYLTAKNQKESLEKQLNTLNQQYDLTKLISPINGVVDAVDIKPGQMGAPGVAGIRVVNFSNLKVKGEVSETYSALVHQGDHVKLFFPDLNKEIDSKITFAGKVISQQSRTFSVEASVSGENDLKPNMIAVMKIRDYENPSAFVLDIGLIQKSGEGKFVYVAMDDNGKKTAQRKQVTVGQIYDGQAEVTSGLSAGDMVITTGYQDLVAGQAIRY